MRGVLRLAIFGFLLVLFFLVSTYHRIGSDFDFISYLNYPFAFAALVMVAFLCFRLIIRHLPKMKKHCYPLIVLAFFAVVLVVILGMLPLRYSFFSDTPYYEYAVQAAYLDGFNFNNSFAAFFGPHGFVNGLFVHFFHFFVHDYFLAAKLAAMLFFLVSLLFMYGIVYIVTQKKSLGILGAVLFASNFCVYATSVSGSVEMVGVSLALGFFLSLLVWHRYHDDDSFGLMAIVFILLLQLRPSNGILIVPALVYVLIARKFRMAVRHCWTWCLFSLFLLMPFIMFYLFSGSSLSDAMRYYGNPDVQEFLGMAWWEGVFSPKYFFAVFPNVMKSLFLPNPEMPVISLLLLPAFLLLLFSGKYHVKLLLVLWFILPATIFSGHFMSFPLGDLYPRYYVHLVPPLIIIVCLSLAQFGGYAAAISKRIAGVTPTWYAGWIVMGIAILFVFSAFIYHKAGYDASLESMADPDFVFFDVLVEKTVPKGCAIVGRVHNARDYVAYLHGYSFFRVNRDFDFSSVNTRCVWYLCDSDNRWVISKKNCLDMDGLMNNII